MRYRFFSSPLVRLKRPKKKYRMRISPSFNHPSHFASASYRDASKMCRYRQVQNTYLRCGHSVRLPDQLIACDDRFCKFSARHPSNCGPNCGTTCWQRKQFPEQYNPHIDNYCPSCINAGRR
ncbi:hypothetical protein C8J56DRAFT_955593 [Mycena floridula]|nr:hypothetical protein C8J56DRAFT_955593 [Mycena floridula]